MHTVDVIILLYGQLRCITSRGSRRFRFTRPRATLCVYLRLIVLCPSLLTPSLPLDKLLVSNPPACTRVITHLKAGGLISTVNPP